MARGDFPSAKQDQFVLRFPDGLRDHLKLCAEASGRSMNAEIIARLMEYDRLRDELMVASLKPVFEKLERIEKLVSEGKS